MQGKPGMIFTIEFFRIRPNDDAHATLDRLSVIVDDLDAAKVKARSFFETLEMPDFRNQIRQPPWSDPLPTDQGHWPTHPARDVLRRCYTGYSLSCQGEMLSKF